MNMNDSVRHDRPETDGAGAIFAANCRHKAAHKKSRPEGAADLVGCGRLQPPLLATY
jgi:hypothetical protein